MSPPTQVAEAQPAPTEGVTSPSRDGGSAGFLSDVIVEMGFASAEAVEKAILDAREAGCTVSAALLDAGVLDESQLARAVAKRHGLAYVDLDEFDVDPAVGGLISRAAALRYQAAPIALAEDGALLVAFEDPVDAFAVGDIEVATKSKVRPVVATASAIEALIATIPPEASGSVNGASGGVNGDLVEAREMAPPPIAKQEPAPEERPATDELTEHDPAREEPPAPEEPTASPQPPPPSDAEPVSATEQPPVGSTAQPSTPTPSPPASTRGSGKDVSARFQEKVASVIEEALEGAAESEMAELGRELESARGELDELAAQLDATRREKAQHAEEKEALRAQFSGAEAASERLKEALSNLQQAASEAQVAADALENQLSG